MSTPLIAAIDVGAPANIGWWASDPGGEQSGTDLDTLGAVVGAALNADRPVALGFEAPLYVPMPGTAAGLNKQRVGERGRRWCAGAGTGALAMGTQQAGYLLQQIAAAVLRPVVVSFDPAKLAEPSVLRLWEAFVSGKAKDRAAADPRVDDARVAVAEFRRRFDAGAVTSDIDDSASGVLNLVAAGALAAGLTTDTALLSCPCVVVRAPDLG